MPDFVKLAIGETITFPVKTVTVDRAGKWPDYHLTAQDGRIIVAPQGALDRQLERLTMSPVELVGHYITIERAPNKEDAKKSWWNLSLANKSDANPTPSKRIPSPPTAGQREFDAAVPPDSPATAMPTSQDPDAPLAGDLPAESTPDAKDAKRAVVVDAYLALYDYMAAELVKCGRAHDFPVDSIGVNAAVATLWITLNNRGLA